MSSRPLRRGQPLVALLLVMSSWVGARVILWEGPTWPANKRTAPFSAPPAARSAPRIEARLSTENELAPHSAAFKQGVARRPAPPSRPALSPEPFARPALNPLPAHTAGPAPQFVSVKVAGGHQLLWMAALVQLPLPASAALAQGPSTPANAINALPAARVPAAPPSASSKWSADGWILLRRGGAGLAVGGAPSAFYGASQAGAVIRYRVSASSPLQPRLYVRASAAIDQPRDRELAAGFALRPVRGLPVVAQAEIRALASGSSTRVRPAAMLVTAIDPVTLPAGLRVEPYAAVGYVGGGDATAFADGQIRADRAMARLGAAQLWLGAGAWGGVQKGAGRIDIGPTATLGVPVGSGSARVSADWRFRIAGQANPGNGPAVTISAGF